MIMRTFIGCLLAGAFLAAVVAPSTPSVAGTASPQLVRKLRHDTAKNSINNVRKTGKPGNDSVTARAKVMVPDLKKGAGGKGGKGSFNDFSFTHKIDKASPRNSDGKPKTPLLTSPGLLDASGGGHSATGPAAAGAAPRPAAPAAPAFR